MPALVADRVRAALPTLPRAERRVAHQILTSYPVSGLHTVARLAERSDVSGPTVVRLIARLGFDNYADFQAALLSEIEERNASPLSQHDRGSAASGHVLPRTATILGEAVSASLCALDEATFATALELLCDKRRRLLTAGGRFSGLIARSLHEHMSILRPGCRHLDQTEWVSYLQEVRPRDVLVMFDMRRYQRGSVLFAREASRRGATLVLVTDPWMSPLAVDATVVLSVPVESSSPFDSQVPALALCEALVAGAVETFGDSVTRRISDYDDLWDTQAFGFVDAAGSA